MLETAFSSPNLGLIAYARVLSDGTAPDLNSGVAVERLSTGVYQITLPDGMGEPAESCLTLVQPFGTFATTTAVEHVSDRVKVISTNIREGGKSDQNFYVAFFRTTGKYDWVKPSHVMYVKVNADGTIPAGNPNSGIAAARLAAGRYRLTLPVSQGQELNDSLLFVMPIQVANPIPILWFINALGHPLTSTANVKNLTFFNRVGGLEDAPFFAMIMQVVK